MSAVAIGVSVVGVSVDTAHILVATVAYTGETESPTEVDIFGHCQPPLMPVGFLLDPTEHRSHRCESADR